MSAPPLSVKSEIDHSAIVDAWLSARAKGLSNEQLVEALEEAFRALWQRGLLTLGVVTLGAIADRVAVVASGRFPILAPLHVEDDGLGCEGLRAKAPVLPRAQLAEAIRFVLVELLSVVGALTAEILTPALHAELTALAVPGGIRPEIRPEKARRRERRGEAESS